jgi:hypothetical protein
MQEFIATLRKKPEHIRKRIALGSSAGITALAALIWGLTLSTNGTFALSSQPAAVSGNDDAYVLSGTSVKSNFSQLVGAVGAVTGATTSEPDLKIIDGNTTSTFDQATSTNTDATVISF